MTAGYSKTPLVKKLGIKAGARVRVRNAPVGYRNLLRPIPARVKFTRTHDDTTDLVHVFVRTRAELRNALPDFRKNVRPGTPVWVSWPKLGSGVPTNVTEDIIRAAALPLGFVDVKVCAVNKVWSALKLVVRKEER